MRPLITARFALAALLPTAAVAAPDVSSLVVPDGFTIEVFSDDVPGARQMVLGDQGTLFVSTRGEGKVYAVAHDGTRATNVREVAKGLRIPSGIAFRDGALFVGAVDRVLRYDGIEGKLAMPPKPVQVGESWPDETHHGARFLAFGPDGKLYVPVGAPCNICEPSERHALIARMNVDGSGYEVVARGVRNTVGFDWNPADRSLWFTENGRDWLGDDTPPCELNRSTKVGEHFGYPYCHGGTIKDPEFGDQRACGEFVAPALNFGAHTAPLGMRFYTGTQFPAAYRGGIFVAQHGSWNRSRKIGYQVLYVPVSGAKAGEAQPFVTGFLQGERVGGRPADVFVMPDGALLVSDDQQGAIYRVSYGASNPAAPTGDAAP